MYHFKFRNWDLQIDLSLSLITHVAKICSIKNNEQYHSIKHETKHSFKTNVYTIHCLIKYYTKTCNGLELITKV